MATGFEIVGVVLAAFPIVVEGLKFYAEEKGVIKSILKYQHVLKRMIRDLTREHTSFHNSCKLFLQDVASRSGYSELEVSDMMQDPKWSEIHLHDHVISEESVQRYLETVEDMNEELSMIQNWLGLRKDDTPIVLDRSTRYRQWKKIILMIRQDEIEQHLRRASHLNSFLARLTEQNRPIASSYRPPRRGTRHYKMIQTQAVDLYDTLYAKFPTPPTCGCPLRHEVNIRLDFRTARNTAKGFYFHLAFTFDAKEHAHATCRWKELEMQFFDTDTALKENMNITQTNIIKVESQSTIIKATSEKVHKSQKKVGFCLNNFDSQSPHPNPSYQEILDLCAIVSASRNPTDWFGAVTNRKGKQHRIRAVDQGRAISVELTRPQTISLSELLRQKTLRREYGSRLGLKLASSVMQFHTTEWLSDHWSADDIFFVQSTDTGANLEYPLVKRSFGSQDGSVSVHTLSLSPSQVVPCLFSLAIVLIELWYCQPFKELKNETENAMDLQYSQLMAANRLVRGMDAGPLYNGAVRFALDCSCESLADDRFRDEVEQKVILPLEETLKFYCGKEAIEECL
ncbi:hypothetical protein FE257_004542 [Aspergillus nanangensis]|uniref:DUF7580 domain-containing protein n=1 Tax=Aspergillus nanangensis TaxID=2582783 RepID=A0AAD4CY79_ASPNN|nr:hypothetical protein FE257_004542 [Aspergillus nanangensis]